VTDYTFLPWVRRGVSRSLTGAVAPTGPGRAALSVSIDVNGSPVGVPMAMHGPGDAIGLARAAIARVDPVPDAVDAEPFLFASIELVPADLPWLLTPGGPDGNGRLLPWLALLVVPRDAGHIGPAPAGGLDRLEVDPAQLPPPDEAWAWAHAQLLGALSGSAADSLDSEPGRWRARILSPRRLDPGQSYLAALVPVFAAGAAAGLGAPAPAQPLAFAWDPAGTETVTLPVYHHWAFATSHDADFETLARRLVGRELPSGVGRLAADFSQPGTGVHGATDDGLWVEGALSRIGDELPPLPAGAARMSADIAELVARTAAPLVVGPPLYGPGPAANSASGPSGSTGAPSGGMTIPAAGWQREVNVDPRVRAITGVGAAIIRRDQEALVASAWRQVGDMRAANRSLNWLALAGTVGRGLYRRHFAQASVATLTQWATPAQTQVLMNPASPLTLAAMVLTTSLSPSALGAPARRLLRTTGPLTARAMAGAVATASGTPLTGPGAPPTGPGPGTPTGPAIPPTGPTGPVHPTHPAGPTHASGGHPAHEPLAPGGPVATGGGQHPMAIDPAGGSPGAGSGSGSGTVHVGPGGHGVADFGRVLVNGGVMVAGTGESPTTPPGLVTMERVHQLMGDPADLAGFTTDGLTSAAVHQRALLHIATALVDENGGSSGLPPNSHSTFAAAAEATQDAVLAELTLGRRPPAQGAVGTIDRAQLLAALDPAPRFAAVAALRVTAPAKAATRDSLDPVRIAPIFPQPAVVSLLAVAPELLLPGLDTLDENTITLATTDQRFVEAFLLGMNHELERELRWRGFPTVAGSTSFRRFWDTPPDHTDIEEISGWAPDSALGTHGGSAAGADTVVVIRGDLIRRFPGIAVTAIPLVNGNPDPDPAQEISPVLRGALEPDVLFAGFAFPPTRAAEFAYVLTQQPGAPRFGLDEESSLDAASVAQRNDLAWSQLDVPDRPARFATAAGPLAGRTIVDASTLASALWGRNAADMAWLTRQAPIRLVIPGPELLSGLAVGPP